MAVYPNIQSVKFCDWLLNYSWFRFSTSQLNTINTVLSAGTTLTSVTDTQYNNFIQTTSWRYKYFEVFNNGQNYQGSYLSAYLNELLVQPSTAYITALNTLINTLTTDNNIQLLDRLWLLAAETEQAALISVINPTSQPAVKFGTPTFTASRGYKSNANNQAILLNFSPALNGVNYSLNNNCTFLYSRTNSQSANIDHGETFGSGPFIKIRDASNLALFRNSTTSNASVSNSNSDKLISLARTTSILTTLYRDGSSLGTSPLASANLSNVNQSTISANQTTFAGTAREIAIVGYGSGSLDQTKLKNAINTFATSIGFNV